MTAYPESERTKLDLKTLQSEMVAIKQKWGKEIKLSKAEKGAPGFPFPISVTRAVPKPEQAHMWDVETLSIKLVVKSESGEIGAECMEKQFPKKVLKAIKKHILELWQAKRAASENGNSSCMEAVFNDIEGSYVKLLRLVPKAVDSYEGVDDEGGTIRRFNIPPAETGTLALGLATARKATMASAGFLRCSPSRVAVAVESLLTNDEPGKGFRQGELLDAKKRCLFFAAPLPWNSSWGRSDCKQEWDFGRPDPPRTQAKCDYEMHSDSGGSTTDNGSDDSASVDDTSLPRIGSPPHPFTCRNPEAPETKYKFCIEKGIESAEEEEITEEEQLERIRRAAELLEIQAEKEMAEAEEREREAARKKEMAMNGILDAPQHVQKSKKQLAAENPTRKEKAGIRQRDTAAKCNKPDPEKSKEADKKRRANKGS
eukprot:gene166-979_t